MRPIGTPAIRSITRTSLAVQSQYTSGILSNPERRKLRRSCEQFAASRVSPGGSYDELVDNQTNPTYLSTAMGAMPDGEFRDYGYFSTFAGPDGNRIVVIAGTRDIGVMQVAQSLSQRSEVRELTKRAGTAAAFESLVEVSGMGKTGLHARPLFVSAMKAEKVWDSSG
jgi:hypothetical protein